MGYIYVMRVRIRFHVSGRDNAMWDTMTHWWETEWRHWEKYRKETVIIVAYCGLQTGLQRTTRDLWFSITLLYNRKKQRDVSTTFFFIRTYSEGETWSRIWRLSALTIAHVNIWYALRGRIITRSVRDSIRNELQQHKDWMAFLKEGLLQGEKSAIGGLTHPLPLWQRCIWIKTFINNNNIR